VLLKKFKRSSFLLTLFVRYYAVDIFVSLKYIRLASVLIFQGCCAKYSVSSKPSDGREPEKPTSPLHSETSAPPTAGNHGSTKTSVHSPPNTRTFHTSATNKGYFHLHQQRRLKSSLATDGSTLLAETSKSVTSSDPTGKGNEIDMRVNSSSASSSDSDTSQLQKDAKKVDNASRVSFL